MLDYASPKEFSTTDQRRGVGEHPHRGIETVTLAYQVKWNIETLLEEED